MSDPDHRLRPVAVEDARQFSPSAARHCVPIREVLTRVLPKKGISHTPEVYRQAADADFNLLLSGHTHGGQICLPGGIPITLNSVLPRSMGSGPWKYHDMIGYTSVGAGSSVVPVRFNCPPEITLHHFHLSS
jgi:predicted MPP superfamily phosphohydrolase